VQASEFLSGTLDFLRDVMMLSIGADSILLTVSPRQRPRLQAVADSWSTDALVAALQVLAEARARMRGVAHGRLLAELALVRIARLENLEDLTEMIQRLRALESGSPAPPRPTAPSLKKKLTPTDDTPPSRAATGPAPPHLAAESESANGTTSKVPVSQDVAPVGKPSLSDDVGPLELHVVNEIWPALIKKVGMNLGWKLTQAMPIGLDGPDVLVIGPKPGYNSVGDLCASDEAKRKIADGLQRLLRRPLTVRYELGNEEDGGPPPAESRRADQLMNDPMVQKVVELFEARVLHLEYEGDQDGDDPPHSRG
jgi:DNA polymerase-3 subunit gamma/tau